MHDVQREPGDRAPLPRVHLAAEVLGQRRDVLAPLAQRRHLDRHARRQASRTDPRGIRQSATMLVEIAVGGGDDADVERESASRRRPASPRRPAARAAASPARSLGSSPISSRNSVPPWAASMRPVARPAGVREGAADVAEQLGLGERVGDGGHVDRDERSGRGGRWRRGSAGRSISLPVPGLAADEHRASVSGDLVDAIQRPPHGRVIADDRRAAGRRRRTAVVGVAAQDRVRQAPRVRTAWRRCRRPRRAAPRPRRRPTTRGERQRRDWRAGRRAPS